MAPVEYHRKMAVMNGDKQPSNQTTQALRLILLHLIAVPVWAGDFPELRGPYQGQDHRTAVSIIEDLRNHPQVNH